VTKCDEFGRRALDLPPKDHQYWGPLMLITIFHGPGKLSLDHFLRRHYFV